MIWLFAGSGITKLALAAGGAALLHGPLNSPDTWVIGHCRYAPPMVTKLAYTANADYMPSSHRVVVDLENWSMTPAWQRRHPARGYRDAAASGKWILATPATDLVRSMDPGYRGKIYPEFLRLDLAEKIAPYTSAYEIQAQGAERNPRLYSVVCRIRRAAGAKGTPRHHDPGRAEYQSRR